MNIPCCLSELLMDVVLSILLIHVIIFCLQSNLLGAIRTPLELPIIFPRLLVPLNGASMIISVLSVFYLLNSFMNEFKQIAVEFKDSNVTSIGRI